MFQIVLVSNLVIACLTGTISAGHFRAGNGLGQLGGSNDLGGLQFTKASPVDNKKELGENSGWIGIPHNDASFVEPSGASHEENVESSGFSVGSSQQRSLSDWLASAGNGYSVSEDNIESLRSSWNSGSSSGGLQSGSKEGNEATGNDYNNAASGTQQGLNFDFISEQNNPAPVVNNASPGGLPNNGGWLAGQARATTTGNAVDNNLGGSTQPNGVTAVGISGLEGIMFDITAAQGSPPGASGSVSSIGANNLGSANQPNAGTIGVVASQQATTFDFTGGKAGLDNGLPNNVGLFGRSLNPFSVGSIGGILSNPGRSTQPSGPAIIMVGGAQPGSTFGFAGAQNYLASAVSGAASPLGASNGGVIQTTGNFGAGGYPNSGLQQGPNFDFTSGQGNSDLSTKTASVGVLSSSESVPYSGGGVSTREAANNLGGRNQPNGGAVVSAGGSQQALNFDCTNVQGCVRISGSQPPGSIQNPGVTSGTPTSTSSVGGVTSLVSRGTSSQAANVVSNGGPQQGPTFDFTGGSQRSQGQTFGGIIDSSKEGRSVNIDQNQGSFGGTMMVITGNQAGSTGMQDTHGVGLRLLSSSEPEGFMVLKSSFDEAQFLAALASAATSKSSIGMSAGSSSEWSSTGGLSGSSSGSSSGWPSDSSIGSVASWPSSLPSVSSTASLSNSKPSSSAGSSSDWPSTSSITSSPGWPSAAPSGSSTSSSSHWSSDSPSHASPGSVSGLSTRRPYTASSYSISDSKGSSYGWASGSVGSTSSGSSSGWTSESQYEKPSGSSSGWLSDSQGGKTSGSSSGWPSGSTPGWPSDGQHGKSLSGWSSGPQGGKSSGLSSGWSSASSSGWSSGSQGVEPSSLPFSWPTGSSSGWLSGSQHEKPSGLSSSWPSGSENGKLSNSPSGWPSGSQHGKSYGSSTAWSSGSESGKLFISPSGWPSGSQNGKPSSSQHRKPHGLPSAWPSDSSSGWPSGPQHGKPSGLRHGKSSAPSSAWAKGSPHGKPSHSPSGRPSDASSGWSPVRSNGWK